MVSPHNGSSLKRGDLVTLDFEPILTPFRVSMTSNGLEELGGIDALMETIEIACCQADRLLAGMDTLMDEVTTDLDSVGFTYDEICQINAALYLFGEYFVSTLLGWGLYDRATHVITVRFVGWVDTTTAAFEYLGLDSDGYLALDPEFEERECSEWYTRLQRNSRDADRKWNGNPSPIEKASFLRKRVSHGQTST